MAFVVLYFLMYLQFVPFPNTPIRDLNDQTSALNPWFGTDKIKNKDILQLANKV
jgi:hypothetical protein